MNKKKSVIINWIYSYILILFIPILTIFIIYYYNNKVIEKQIIHANKLVLQNLQQNLDTEISHETSQYTSLLTSPEFFSLISHEKATNTFYSDVMETIRFLHTNSSSSQALYLLYLKEKNHVLWNGVSSTSEVCYNAKNFPNITLPDYEEWMQLLSRQYDNDFFVTSYLNYNSTSPCLVYADTVAYKGYEPVNTFFYIPVSDIISYITSLSDDTLLLIHYDNEVILALNNQGAVELPAEIQELAASNNMFTNDVYVGLHKDSGQTKLTYSLLIPRQTFYQESKHVRNVLLLSLAGTIIVGLISAFYLAKRNFSPLSTLLLKTTGEVKIGNEFTQIEHAFLNLDSENKQMRNRIMTQREIMQKNYLLAMMKGKYDILQNHEQLYTEFYPNEQEGIVLVGYEVPMLDKHQLKHDDLLWFAIDNAFWELMPQEKMYRVEDGTYLFYLFIISKDDAPEWRKVCLEKMNVLCDMLENKWGIAVPSAISSFEGQIEQIRFLYQDIIDAIEYKEIIGGKGAIDAETLKDSPDSLSIQSLGMFIEMAFLQGDYDKIAAISQELFDRSGRTPFLLFRMQVLEVFHVVATFYEQHEVEEGKRLFLAGYLTPLLTASDKKEMKKCFDELLTYVYQNTYQQDQDKHLVPIIREYIETHFTDSSMNISTIADAIGQKSRLISRVFKEETNEGILDYINNLRITRAKLLLLTGKYSLEEVSNMSGYASYKTFRRIFVKLTGVTPGKYTNKSEPDSQE